ncbi:aminopeptidase N [Actinomadura sp. 21ATH]|uniref:aminopeptidase N n=1 Tax=Actinomadura sp. 21ATH TaxID=1735444 RepID=UPI0035BF73E1
MPAPVPASGSVSGPTPVSPLTRAEALARSTLLDVGGAAVDLDLTRGDAVFGSVTTLRFRCARPGAATFAEIVPGTLRRAVLNGRELDPGALRGGRLPLPDLAARNELRVEADLEYSRTGEGLHRCTDPADGEVYVYACCGPGDTPRVFAAFDQPDLKTPLAFTVTAPAHWTVLSNAAGRRTGTAPGGAARWEFAPTPPISPHLAALVAGPLHSVRAGHDGIPLGLHCRRSLAPHLDAEAAGILDVTRRSLDRHHELFRPRYAFGKYDQAFVPEFGHGAVENPGCVTFREEFLFTSPVPVTERDTRAVVIAHEMAHMWFGDLVTMRWWDDLWLSESFAEYIGHRVAAETGVFPGAWTSFAVTRKPWAYDTDQRPTTHPVAPGDVPDTAAAFSNFDGISYAKGASALRQLVAWIGDEAFLAGVNAYFDRHRFGNADLGDLLGALARASGRDVHGWAERWLRTTGIDVIGPAGTPAARPHLLQVGLYDRDGGTGRLVARERVRAEIAPGAPARVAAPGGAPRADLVLPNDGDHTYAKIRLDEDSWRAAAEGLSGIADPLPRAVLWNAARDMVRDAELTPAEFLELAARHLPAETEPAVAAAMLAFARTEVADRYLPPERRPAALASLAATCRAVLGRGGAALRPIAARTLVECTGAGGAGGLRALLTAGDGGGTRDAEPYRDALAHPGAALRWDALARLCVLGAAGEDDIAAERRRDRGASADAGAARCRAALPDPAAKERAWRGMLGGGDAEHAAPLSPHLVAATAAGFWHPETAALTAPYVGRYFEEVPAAAARGAAVAKVLGTALFPAHAVSPATERAAARRLDRGGLPPALWRALTERLDDLRRALRVRAADRDAAAAP